MSSFLLIPTKWLHGLDFFALFVVWWSTLFSFRPTAHCQNSSTSSQFANTDIYMLASGGNGLSLGLWTMRHGGGSCSSLVNPVCHDVPQSTMTKLNLVAQTFRGVDDESTIDCSTNLTHGSYVMALIQCSMVCQITPHNSSGNIGRPPWHTDYSVDGDLALDRCNVELTTLGCLFRDARPSSF